MSVAPQAGSDYRPANREPEPPSGRRAGCYILVMALS